MRRTFSPVWASAVDFFSWPTRTFLPSPCRFSPRPLIVSPVRRIRSTFFCLSNRILDALRWTGLEGISMVTAVWCVIGVRAKCKSTFAFEFRRRKFVRSFFRWNRTECSRRQPSLASDATDPSQHHRILLDLYSGEVSLGLGFGSE